MTVNVSYENAGSNNVRNDAEKAIQLFLSGSVGTSMIIYPQALNPLLKALESLCIWKQVMVLPFVDKNNKPLYVLVKIPDNGSISSVTVGE